MLENVDTTIAGLRSVVGAKNDADLAGKLGLDKSTISGWRSRGRVPDRFVRFLRADAFEKEVWPELYDRAIAVGNARYAMLQQNVLNSNDLNQAMAAFLHTKPYWLVMHRAMHELRIKMEVLGIDLSTAAALLLQNDLQDTSATAKRVADLLAEDIADSPEYRDMPQFGRSIPSP